MDDTSQKIIDATMVLIRDKGYVATTTKDIASLADVNECTIFRKFKCKKDIVTCGISQDKWRAHVTPDIFQPICWDLETDLIMFMHAYMSRVTPDFVNLSIGLRAPQLYDETAPMIMKIPQIFMDSLVKYFEEMELRGKLPHMNFEQLAMTIFSSTFGFTFLTASFQENLTSINQQEFIQNSVQVFVKGISQ